MSPAASRSSPLFILHAEADAWFVRGVLLDALGLSSEAALLTADLPLGRPLLVELEARVRQSRLTLVVVSQAFIADEWSKHTEVLASHRALSGDGVVIPLRLDDCEVPLHLAALISLDLRRRERWSEELARLRRQLPARLELDLAQATEEPPACPYPGMRPFRADEGHRFFGREREIESIVSHLRSGERLLFALGPSGSGKSSLLHAGVLPLLRGEEARLRYDLPRMTVRVMRPGERPAERLAELVGAASAEPAAVAVAAAVAGELLVFVDQLEEAFTVAAAGERERFWAQLVALRHERRCRLLLAARADFFGALIDGPLWAEGKAAHVAVAPLRGAALRKAIAAPASAVGVAFEPGLVERLVADAEGEPGVLPLLQETLVRLWARKQWRVLSLADYEELGRGGRHGLAVAISHHADACLRQQSAAQEACARRVLLRLVAFGDGVADARRQQRRGELGEGEDPRLLAATLEALAQGRLITLDGGDGGEGGGGGESGDGGGGGEALGRVDLAHEALLWAWPTLAQWIASRRREERQRRGLVEKVAEWRARRREDATAGLLDVLELRDAEGWLGSDSARELGEVSGLAELVEASRAQRSLLQRQREESKRLLGAMYLESGRQLLLDEHPQRAVPYLVAAREELGATAALQMLFHAASRAVVRGALPHRAAVCVIAVCPESGRVATGCVDGEVQIWDVSSGEAVTPVLAHDAAVLGLSFSRDGRVVVVACADGSVRQWDAERGRAVAAVVRHDRAVAAAALSPDGSRLLTASPDGAARLWDARSGQPLTPPLAHDGEVTAVAFSADQRRVLTGSQDGTARLWDAATGALAMPPLRHLSGVERAEFACDGARVVTAGGKAVRLWDAATGEGLAVLHHGAPVTRVCVSPDGRRVATASADRTARVWDAATGEPSTPPLGHGASVEHVAFSSSGRLLVSCGADRAARVWDAASGRLLVPLEHGHAVSAAELSLDERAVITVGADGAARVWELEELRAPLRLEHGRSVRGAAFSPDGAKVVTVSRGQHALVWDVARGAPLLRLAHERPVRAAAFSPDGRDLATASWDQTARVWDAQSGAPRSPKLWHRGGVEQLAWSRGGDRIATASTDGVARVWDAASGELLRSLGPHGGPVRDVAFSMDDARVITGGDDGTARLWDAASGELRAAWSAHGKAITSAAFSPDGEQVLTASEDGTARLWDVATLRPRPQMMEHGGPIYRAAFSPEGQRVVTASADKTAQVWDASTGRPLGAPMAHGDRVLCAAFSADGQRVITASHDRAAQVWDAALDLRSLEQWRALAERCVHLLSSEPPSAARGQRGAGTPARAAPAAPGTCERCGQTMPAAALGAARASSEPNDAALALAVEELARTVEAGPGSPAEVRTSAPRRRRG